MVRTTVKICLFTFFTFSQFLILNTPAHARTDVPMDYKELMYLPEANPIRLQRSKFERLFQIDCNFQNRFQLSHASDNQDGLPIGNLIADAEFDAPPVPRPTQNLASALSDTSSEPIWSAANQLVQSQRASLISNWRAAGQNIQGFCSWANERIEPTVSIQSKTVLLPPKTSKWKLAPIQQNISVPLFLIADQPTKTIGLNPIQRHQIPMFLVVDQTVADQSEACHAESGFAEDNLFESDQAQELQDAETLESPISTEIENDSDPYWQYYDDCDRWGVDFARLLQQSVLVEPIGSVYVDSRNSFVVMASFEANTIEAQPRRSHFSLLHALSAHCPSVILCSVPPIFDFKAQSLNELIAVGEFNFVEQQNIQPELVYVRPLGPITQALVLQHMLSEKPVWHSLSKLPEEINFKSLSCYIHEAQIEYAGQIEVLLVKANQANLARQNQFRHRVADRITQASDWLETYADSIRPIEAPIVATNPESTATTGR